MREPDQGRSKLTISCLTDNRDAPTTIPQTSIITQTMETIHLTLRNLRGSVEHYWHFFMGYYMPLLEIYETLHLCEKSKIFVRSCGPMNPHLQDPQIPHLEILSKEQHAKLAKECRSDVNYLVSYGMDQPQAFERERLARAKACFLKLPSSHNKTPDQPKNNAILIDRGPPNPYYLTTEAEIRGGGASRRSLPNFEELLAQAMGTRPDVECHYLENYSLPQQFQCFWNAELVVFQHGAAMANLIFCRAGTKVIEIIPETLPASTKNKAYAKKLSDILGLNYFCLMQSDLHTPVDSTLFGNVFKKVNG
jgi:hypothetical protein